MTDEDPANAAAISVLVCDDVAQMRALLNAIIAMRPCLRMIGEAGNGHDAISQAATLQPDVILLDLSMPGMTGFDALPQLKDVAPHAKVIVLSGFAAELIAADVLARGADRYIEKGATPTAIADAIETIGRPALVNRTTN